jgi:hypothetical protein
MAILWHAQPPKNEHYNKLHPGTNRLHPGTNNLSNNTNAVRLAVWKTSLDLKRHHIQLTLFISISTWHHNLAITDACKFA